MKKEATHKTPTKTSKKAQVTIFVILGLVLTVMVFFILFAISQISEMNAQKEKIQSASNLLDSATLNYYVQTCLDSATTQAIDEIMIQGGTLYTHQNGTKILSDEGETHIKTKIEYENNVNKTTNVSYSITQTNNCELINYDIPDYPKKNTKLADLFKIYDSMRFNNGEPNMCFIDKKTHKDLSGFFGQNNLTRLCFIESKNSETIKGVGVSPCNNNLIKKTETNNPDTIEELLQKRILHLLDNCVNFDMIDELQGTNIQLDNMDKPEINVIFNKNSLSVNASYPFTAQFAEGESEIIKKDFNYASPLRIIKLHNYAMSLLAADTKDIKFNLSSKQEQQSYEKFTQLFPNIKDYYDPYFEVSIIPAQCSPGQICKDYEYDNILIIKDKLSHIGGRYLTFATAIKNRRPALDIISEFEPINRYSYDILVGVGEELIIDPQGYDPDDKSLKYVYEGWKEDYDKTCTLDDNSFNCETIYSEDEPNYLTNSQLFEETKRKVNYTTNETDIGLHNVRVAVQDAGGLSDFQRVKILVFNLPETSVTTQSLYDEYDIPENVTSIEDPIILEGNIDTETGYSVNEINYKWIIRTSTGWLILEKDGLLSDGGNTPDELNLPQTDVPNIQNIHNLNLTTNGVYNVILDAVVSYGGEINQEVEATPFELNLQVKQCIPYRSDDLIYPYNTNNNNNPFLANHTCCLGEISEPDNYELADNNVPCYTASYFGSYKKLSDQAQEELKEDKLQEYNGGKLIETGVNSNSNNVFKLELKRVCDGIRGNICAGDLTANFEQVTACEYNSTLQEQCTGPPTSIQSGEYADEMRCIDYTTTSLTPNNRQTFEYLHEDGATGACLTEPKCSTIGNEGYNDGGSYLCENAYCNTGECTKTFDIQCSCDENCGAQCGYLGAPSSLWENNMCNYGDCSGCGFESSVETKCTADNEDCYNENDEYCYMDVECTPEGPQEEQGEFCKTEELIQAIIQNPENEDDELEVNVCLHGDLTNDNMCDSDGECQLDKTFFTCNEGEARCINTGAKCRIGNDLSNPNPDLIYDEPEVNEYLI